MNNIHRFGTRRKYMEMPEMKNIKDKELFVQDK